MLLEEIKYIYQQAHTASKPVAFLRFNVSVSRMKLKEWGRALQSGSELRTFASKVSDVIEPAPAILMNYAHKLVPLTTFGKLLSIGRNVKPEKRSLSVRFANAKIDKHHKVFKGIHMTLKVLTRLLVMCAEFKTMLQQSVHQTTESFEQKVYNIICFRCAQYLLPVYTLL